MSSDGVGPTVRGPRPLTSTAGADREPGMLRHATSPAGGVKRVANITGLTSLAMDDTSMFALGAGRVPLRAIRVAMSAEEVTVVTTAPDGSKTTMTLHDVALTGEAMRVTVDDISPGGVPA